MRFDTHPPPPPRWDYRSILYPTGSEPSDSLKTRKPPRRAAFLDVGLGCPPPRSLGHEELLHHKVLAAREANLVHAALQGTRLDVQRVVHIGGGHTVKELADENAVHRVHVDAKAHVLRDREAEETEVVRRVRLQVGHANRRLAGRQAACSR